MKRKTSGLSCLLGVDKPVGVTSHDVVSSLRRHLSETRIGHAGTLDPLASGVLIVGVGPATRLMQYATAQTKGYRARISFGRSTTTDDAQGQTVRRADVPAEILDRLWASGRMAVLTAMREQVPPAFSAIHVNGKRAYEQARAGEAVDLEPRPIEVLSASLVAVGENDGEPYWDVDLLVSKGTYIRAIARDLGKALGSAAYVSALRRIASGGVTIASCAPLQTFAREWDGATGVLDPVSTLGIEPVAIGADDLAAIRDGKRLSVACVEHALDAPLPDDRLLGLVYDTKLYALARKAGHALVPSPVFRDGVGGFVSLEDVRG